jgi:dodecin
MMANDVFKGISIVGTSNQSFSHAIEVAIERAQQTLRELKWFKVTDQTGAVLPDGIQYQVTIEVFFKLQGENLSEP